MAGGRPAPQIRTGNHLEIPCQACFLWVTLTTETDVQMELRQKAAQVLRNALVINAWCRLSAMYTKSPFHSFPLFFQTTQWMIFINHNERKLRSSMYSQMAILWNKGSRVCVYVCVCTLYVYVHIMCVYSLKKQQKSTCQIVKSITKYHNAA